ncbi:helix-turn-helix transcriptional regulator [Actinoplanes sp. NPDC051851]|uniref:helix-turn-helix transcriptional regulator n=1 Tax=Actinoplanes sp. NPDC051851 TaxID=3154753 RepID=UPI00341CE8E9
MTEVFETDDLGEAHALLERTYTRMRLNVTGDRHHLRIARTEVGPVSLHHVTLSMDFVAELQPIHLIPISRVRAGQARHDLGAGIVESGPGDVFVPALPGREFRVQVKDYDVEHAWFPPAIFAQVAAGEPGRAPRPIRFTGHRPHSSRAATTWENCFDYVRTTVAGIPADEEPLLVGSTARMLAAVALSTFPNTALVEPTVADQHDAHPATLRRAIAFIDENAHGDITPAEIALAARVTIRSLQLAFRRHLGTTPTAYLRDVRLQRAHRHLLEADPATTTVSAVAMRWGFASHSSFTAAYHAAFGVLPSETLRRR